MIKNTKHNWHKKLTKATKRPQKILYIMLISAALIISISITSATTSSGQLTKVAGSETQFSLSVAYAYVGKFTGNASYHDFNGTLMSIISQYPSEVVLNTTRAPGVKIQACEAEIEVYGVQMTTDTGLVENHAYFVGTNYNSSFSASELSSLVPHISDLVDREIYSQTSGDFNFNWTDNSCILSHSVGSVGAYSNANSSLGLWSSGKPHTISVSVHRIGYITINDGSVSIYKDQLTNETAKAILSNYGDGFIQNSLIPADRLSQTDLFHPNH